MLKYVKVSYKSNNSNQALFKCIAYIGRTHGRIYKDPFKEGVRYLSKKVKGASKSAVKNMVFPHKIQNRKEIHQWWFKHKVYARIYSYIINTLMQYNRIYTKEASLLLRDLYISLLRETKGTKEYDKILSNVLVFEQKQMLDNARDKEIYPLNDRKQIRIILNTIDDCDKYSKEFFY